MPVYRADSERCTAYTESGAGVSEVLIGGSGQV
jgi:hypothetical protein